MNTCRVEPYEFCVQMCVFPTVQEIFRERIGVQVAYYIDFVFCSYIDFHFPGYFRPTGVTILELECVLHCGQGVD